MPRRLMLPFLLGLHVASALGCEALPASTEQVDTTDPGDAERETEDPRAEVLSAFFGLDGTLSGRAYAALCQEGSDDTDGMPIIFSDVVELETLQAGDIEVTLESGAKKVPACVTFAPALDTDEIRTALLLGDLGDHPDDPPVRVEIVGHVLSSDGVLDFQGAQIDVTPLPDGPSIVLAEVVPEADWNLGASSGRAVGSGCPEGTKQVVRAVWAGGITRPGGDELEDEDFARYSVTLEGEGGSTRDVAPFAVGDLGDQDNNHELCLDVEGRPLSVSFPAGFVTDPNEDLNPDTMVDVTQ